MVDRHNIAGGDHPFRETLQVAPLQSQERRGRAGEGWGDSGQQVLDGLPLPIIASAESFAGGVKPVSGGGL